MLGRTPATRGLVALLLFGILACDPASGGPRLEPEVARRLAEARAEAASSPAARVRLGELELEAGLYFEAAETFLKAKEEGSGAPEVFAGLAQAYAKLGYIGSTVDALRSCFRVAPQQPNCLYAFATLLERDPSEPAQREVQKTWMRFLRSAPPDHPKRGYAESALAQLNARFGVLSEADLAAPPPPQDKALAGEDKGKSADGAEGHPPVEGSPGSGEGSVGGLNPFGQAIQKAYQALADKKPAAAVDAFQEALALRPDDPPTLAGLAEAELEAGRQEAAIATAEKAWRLDPEDPQVRYVFGLVMLRSQRRGEEALEAWRALLRDTPEYAERLGVDQLLRRADEGEGHPAEP